MNQQPFNVAEQLLVSPARLFEECPPLFSRSFAGGEEQSLDLGVALGGHVASSGLSSVLSQALA